MKNTVIQVFAKAPLAGFAKTRLIPVLGEQGAADLHGELVTRTLKTLIEGTSWPVQLWCAPDCRHPFFENCGKLPRVSLHTQLGSDLGERMHHALSDALASFRQAILVGTDCPALSAADIRESASALDGGKDAVIGPAQDGGYYLVGLNRELPSLFREMAWGGTDVMQQTRNRLKSGDCRWHELPMHRDLDRPEDLAHFPTLLKKNEVTSC